jgi:drug/metabolite transporter (DMT)-like permease
VSGPPREGGDRAAALLLALIGLAAVSHAVIFIRLSGDAPALLLAAARVGLATLLFAPVALIRRPAPDTGEAGWIVPSILAGLFLAVHFGTWIESVQRLTIAESALLVSLSPVWIALAEAALGRGRPPAGVIAGIALCLAGLAVIGWDGLSRAEGDPVGLGLALTGGLAMAGYLMLGKRVRGLVPTERYVAVCYASAAAALTVVALGAGIQITGIPGEAWLAILALGLVSQGIGHTAYNHALGRLSPVFVAICLLGEPVLGSLLGLIYLGEAVPAATLLGAGPILLGLWLAIRAELRRTEG